LNGLIFTEYGSGLASHKKSIFVNFQVGDIRQYCICASDGYGSLVPVERSKSMAAPTALPGVLINDNVAR
jgi:hypothetical protein